MEEIGHSFNQLVPPEKYAVRHPEYYCLFRGVRYASLKPGEANVDFKQGSFPYGMQPCLAEPEVMRIVTENVLNQFASRPHLLNVSVSAKRRRCPLPMSILRGDRRAEGSPTGSLLEFVNGVADEVAKKYPDRMVSTLAYSETVRPPKTIRPREKRAGIVVQHQRLCQSSLDRCDLLRKCTLRRAVKAMGGVDDESVHVELLSP